MKDYCACTHRSEMHDDSGVCFGTVYLNQHGKPDFEGDPHPCKCRKYKESNSRKDLNA